MLHMTKTISPPSKPPRVSVPVDGEVLEVFNRLAKVQNMSTGKAIAEWLRDTVEAAELMSATMERARAAPKVVTAELHAMMLGMAEQTKELQDKFAKFKGSIDEGPKGSGRSTGSAAGRPDESFGQFMDGLKPANPPSCNTGGKLPKKGQRRPKGESS